MTRRLTPAPLTAEAFAPYGDLLDASGAPDKMINRGMCARHNDLARLDFADGRAGISIFDAQARHLPYLVDMVERHPEGSQAFLPLHEHPFLVIVAPDAGGVPGRPLAFRTDGTQGINLRRGTWHGVLTPLAAPGLFAVVDRIGPTPNLQEHWFTEPYRVEE